MIRARIFALCSINIKVRPLKLVQQTISHEKICWFMINAPKRASCFRSRKEEKQETKIRRERLAFRASCHALAPESGAGPKVADTVHRDYKPETLRLKEPVAFLENPIHP
jgi:hypothetical protein